MNQASRLLVWYSARHRHLADARYASTAGGRSCRDSETGLSRIISQAEVGSGGREKLRSTTKNLSCLLPTSVRPGMAFETTLSGWSVPDEVSLMLLQNSITRALVNLRPPRVAPGTVRYGASDDKKHVMFCLVISPSSESALFAKLIVRPRRSSGRSYRPG